MPALSRLVIALSINWLLTNRYPSTLPLRCGSEKRTGIKNQGYVLFFENLKNKIRNASYQLE